MKRPSPHRTILATLAPLAPLLLACAAPSEDVAPRAAAAKLDPTFAPFVDPSQSSLRPVEGGRRRSAGRLLTEAPARAVEPLVFGLGTSPRNRIALRLEGAAEVLDSGNETQARYAAVLPGTELLVSARQDAAEALLVLDEGAPDTFRFAVTWDGDDFADPTVDPRGSLVFPLLGSATDALTFPRPVALDAAGVRHDGALAFTTTGRGEGRLTVTFRHAGLPHPVLLDPSATVWRFRRVDVPTGRWGHASAYDARRRRVVTVGGGNSGTNYYRTTVEFDGSTLETFDDRSILNDGGTLGRGGFGIAYDEARGRVVAFGGLRDAAHFDDLWEYDGNAWTAIPVAGQHPAKRALLAMAYDPRDASYLVFGGADLSQINPDNPLTLLTALKTDTWRFAGGAWTQASPSSTVGAFGASMAFDGARKKMLAFGGARIEGVAFNATNEVSEWTGTTWKTVPTTGTKPERRAFASFVWDPKGQRLLVAGGADNIGSIFNVVQGGSTFFSDLYALADPDGDGTYAWSRLANLDGPIAAAGAAYDEARGQLVLFGGLQGTQDYSAALRLFDGTSWSRITAALPPPRTAGVMGWDAGSKRAILFGGDAGTGGPTVLLSDTWAWNGKGWTQLAVSGPAARKGAAVANLADGILLFGGRTDGASVTADTWIFRGGRWSASNVGAPSTAMNSAAMAYDPSRNVVVRYGGNDSTGDATAQTWEWAEATGWKAITPTTSPPATAGASVFYQPGVGIVTVGGVNKTSFEVSGTWVYEPTAAGGPTWKKLDSAVLGSRRQTTYTATDTARSTTLLYGGRGDTVTDDFFTFDGKVWANLTGSVGTRPSARDDQQMVYDPERRQTLILDGRPSNQQAPFDELWLLQASGFGCATQADCGPDLFCTDGVCCQSSQCGTCETCAGATPGRCAVVAANQPDGRTCTGDKACDGARACKAALGATCTTDAQCAGGICTDGFCCDSRCQDGCRTCDARKMAKAGTPGVCSDAKSWVCKKTCATAQDCIAPDLCNDEGKCVPPPSASAESGCVVEPATVGGGLGGAALVVAGLSASIVRRRRKGR